MFLTWKKEIRGERPGHLILTMPFDFQRISIFWFCHYKRYCQESRFYTWGKRGTEDELCKTSFRTLAGLHSSLWPILWRFVFPTTKLQPSFWKPVFHSKVLSFSNHFFFFFCRIYKVEAGEVGAVRVVGNSSICVQGYEVSSPWKAGWSRVRLPGSTQPLRSVLLRNGLGLRSYSVSLPMVL